MEDQPNSYDARGSNYANRTAAYVRDKAVHPTFAGDRTPPVPDMLRGFFSNFKYISERHMIGIGY
jgi:hypothetical protein